MEDFSPGLESLFEGVDLPPHIYIKQRGMYITCRMEVLVWRFTHIRFTNNGIFNTHTSVIQCFFVFISFVLCQSLSRALLGFS
jgi:hypothetical protein